MTEISDDCFLCCSVLTYSHTPPALKSVLLLHTPDKGAQSKGFYVYVQAHHLKLKSRSIILGWNTIVLIFFERANVYSTVTFLNRNLIMLAFAIQCY